MKIVMAFAALVTAAGPALASLQLAQKSQCMACHGVDKKLVGPAYQDIAKKYAAQKDAEAMLVKSLLEANDIIAYVPDELTAQSAPHFSGSGIHVQVDLTAIGQGVRDLYVTRDSAR